MPCLSVSVSLCVSLPVLAACLCFTLSNHSGILSNISASLPVYLCLFMWVLSTSSLSFALSAHGRLSACLLGVAGCLSVHPLISGSWKHPLRSLMCGCEIPFEYCSSQLLVAKGTGQEKWRIRGGHREPGGGCGHAFLFSSSLLRSFSKAQRKDDNLK